MKSRRRAVLTRANALQDVVVTGIVDERSPCSQITNVITLAYEPMEPGRPQPAQITHYQGTVLPHPDLEVIAGTRQEHEGVYWSNADLAVIILEQPVPPEFPPLALSESEVKVGDALVMVGYGPGEAKDFYGWRHSGENEVTRRIRLETGNVIFSVALSPGPDHEVRAQARGGDSGGAGVRRDHPNVLVGIIAMDAEAEAGNKTSYFTSIYPQRPWLSEIIRRVELAADAGMSVPSSDAGLNALDSDAGSAPSPAR